MRGGRRKGGRYGVKEESFLLPTDVLPCLVGSNLTFIREVGMKVMWI